MYKYLKIIYQKNGRNKEIEYIRIKYFFKIFFEKILKNIFYGFGKKVYLKT